MTMLLLLSQIQPQTLFFPSCFPIHVWLIVLVVYVYLSLPIPQLMDLFTRCYLCACLCIMLLLSYISNIMQNIVCIKTFLLLYVLLRVAVEFNQQHSTLFLFGVADLNK